MDFGIVLFLSVVVFVVYDSATRIRRSIQVKENPVLNFGQNPPIPNREQREPNREHHPPRHKQRSKSLVG